MGSVQTLLHLPAAAVAGSEEVGNADSEAGQNLFPRE
jgi:hypothetical protein